MCEFCSVRQRAFGIALLLSFVVPLSTAVAQSAEGQVPRQGEVTGNDVYVRSGPSLNHYPVCKLNAGTRIAVVGEEHLKGDRT